MGREYNKDRDGKLKDYLSLHDGLSGSNPRFRGLHMFGVLYKEGWILPGRTYIRIMPEDARSDEHYLVSGKNELKGMTDMRYHEGREGEHTPQSLLDQSLTWELCEFTPTRFTRKERRKEQRDWALLAKQPMSQE